MPEGNHSLLCNFVFLMDNIYLKEFEDTEGVIRIRKSKKDRQHNTGNEYQMK